MRLSPNPPMRRRLPVGFAGLGAYIPAPYNIPQNPVAAAYHAAGMGRIGAFVDGTYPVPQIPVGMGALSAFVDGRFPVPQIPVGMGGLGCAACSSGMSGWLTDSGIPAMLSEPNPSVGGLPNWAVYGGMFVGGWWLFNKLSKGGRRK